MWFPGLFSVPSSFRICEPNVKGIRASFRSSARTPRKCASDARELAELFPALRPRSPLYGCLAGLAHPVRGGENRLRRSKLREQPEKRFTHGRDPPFPQPEVRAFQ